MSNFTTAVTVANEIVKAVDFTFAHEQAINNIAVAMQGILAKPDQDMVIGGEVKPYQTAGMNVSIEPIFAHCGSSGIDVVETEPTSHAISFEVADNALDRIDIIQIRGIEELYDPQDRRFRDPETKVESTINISTKKRIKLDIVVKRGSNGSAMAPIADTGYVKLAEISIPAGTVNIVEDNIKNISAKFAGGSNDNWSNQQTWTFNPGYLTDSMKKFLVSHDENGYLKGNSVLASMLKFGSGYNDVNSSKIPIGLSTEIVGQELGPLAPISEVMAALAAAVSLAYPYANNILFRYMLLPHTPVATSTENVNITTGGEKTIDGMLCTTGQLIFLKDQTNSRENGFYEVQSGAWNRFTGYTSETPEAFNSRFIFCEKGTENRGKVFGLIKDSAIGTDMLEFHESIFSPYDLPGKIPIRDKNGQTADQQRITAEIILNADMVDGAGRNLLEVLGVDSIPAAMTEIRRRCNNNGEIDASGIPDFRGIMVGDYIDGLDLSAIPAGASGDAPQAWDDTYKNNRILVSGFNTYKGTGSTENSKNHILFTFRNCPCKNRINATGTNTGGYPSSELRQWLEGASGDGSGSFATGLKAALGGDYLYSISKYHSRKGGTGANNYTVWPPTEIEVFGYQTHGDEIGNYNNTNVHFPIYQKGFEYRAKRLNGSRNYWWLSTPTASGETNFCNVYTNGGVYNNGAIGAYGVAPAFCVA